MNIFSNIDAVVLSIPSPHNIWHPHQFSRSSPESLNPCLDRIPSVFISNSQLLAHISISMCLPFPSKRDTTTNFESQASRPVNLSNRDRRAIATGLRDDSVAQTLNDAGIQAQSKRGDLRRGIFNSLSQRDKLFFGLICLQRPDRDVGPKAALLRNSSRSHSAQWDRGRRQQRKGYLNRCLADRGYQNWCQDNRLKTRFICFLMSIHHNLNGFSAGSSF